VDTCPPIKRSPKLQSTANPNRGVTPNRIKKTVSKENPSISINFKPRRSMRIPPITDPMAYPREPALIRIPIADSPTLKVLINSGTIGPKRRIMIPCRNMIIQSAASKPGSVKVLFFIRENLTGCGCSYAVPFLLG
jgi:hypothetical protein